jgi:steroid delta-isomerase-like uncharacterized protein
MATTTPQELLERYFYEGWNKADVNVIKEVLDENVKFRGSFRRKPLRGHQAFLDYMRSAHKALANNKIEIEDVVVSENGAKAASRLTNRGVHRSEFFGVKASGHEVSWCSAGFFTIRDGRVTEIWMLGDIDGLKNQIGAHAESTAFSS